MDVVKILKTILILIFFLTGLKLSYPFWRNFFRQSGQKINTGQKINKQNIFKSENKKVIKQIKEKIIDPKISHVESEINQKKEKVIENVVNLLLDQIKPEETKPDQTNHSPSPTPIKILFECEGEKDGFLQDFKSIDIVLQGKVTRIEKENDKIILFLTNCNLR